MKVLIMLFSFGGNAVHSVETQYVPSMEACQLVGKVFMDKIDTRWRGDADFKCLVIK